MIGFVRNGRNPASNTSSPEDWNTAFYISLGPALEDWIIRHQSMNIPLLIPA
jgi:hypothetical protein